MGLSVCGREVLTLKLRIIYGCLMVAEQILLWVFTSTFLILLNGFLSATVPSTIEAINKTYYRERVESHCQLEIDSRRNQLGCGRRADRTARDNQGTDVEGTVYNKKGLKLLSTYYYTRCVRGV